VRAIARGILLEAPHLPQGPSREKERLGHFSATHLIWRLDVECDRRSIALVDGQRWIFRWRVGQDEQSTTEWYSPVNDPVILVLLRVGDDVDIAQSGVCSQGCMTTNCRG
jgi:hypothetical protein